MNDPVIVALVVAAVVPALPVLAVLVHLAWPVGRRRRPWRVVLLGPGLLVGVALTSITYAVVVYAIGFFSDLYFLDPDQHCAVRAGFASGRPGPSDSSWTGVEHSYFPLHHICRWGDGTAYELVPGWVNPVFFTLVAVAWLALLARPLATLLRPGPAADQGLRPTEP